MGILDSLRAALNPTGMQGLPRQYTPGAGMKNAAGIMDAFMSFQPQYQQSALGREQLVDARLQNQNTPIMNMLKNEIMKQQGQQLGIQNQYMPQDMQSQIALRNAQAGLAGAETSLMPEKLAIQRMQASPMAQMMRYGTAFTKEQLLNNMLQNNIDPYSPQGQAYLAQNGYGIPQQGTNTAQPGIAPQSASSANALSPQSQQNLAATQLSLNRKTSDAKNREAILKAKQIEQTISAIDMPTVSQYMGPQGRLKAAADYTQAMAGNVSPEYDKYHRFITVQGPEAAKQLRQYFGDSIQPEMAKQYDKLVTPDYWKSNPELAMRQFDELVNMFNRDSTIRVGAITNPGVYTQQATIPSPMGKIKSDTNLSNISNDELLKHLGGGR